MHERETIQLIRSRDERGAGDLLLYYGPLLRYVIAPILPREQDREECLSEAAMRVWSKIDSYDPQRGRWTTWLTARGEAEELSDQIPSGEATPEEALLQKERLAALRKAIDRLAQRDRVIFYRKYYYQQPTSQIASELGMTTRAVEGRLYRTKQKLRDMLGGEV